MPDRYYIVNQNRELQKKGISYIEEVYVLFFVFGLVWYSYIEKNVIWNKTLSI